MMRVVDTYDVFDRRIGKKVDSDGVGGFDRSERFVFDENRDLLHVFADANGDAGGVQNVLTNRFLNGATVDQVMADELVNGGQTVDTYWPLADNLGTNRDVVRRDAVFGTIHSVEHLRFDAFGEILPDDNATYAQRQSYAGLEFDADVGLYYAHHRWYDPITHRFISEDPIGFAGGDSNLARYVQNRPTILIDPTGNLPIWPFFLPLVPFFSGCGKSPAPAPAPALPRFTLSQNPNNSTTITLQQDCLIIILVGHGAQHLPHQFNFEEPNTAGTFIGCDAGTNNKKIKPKHRIPGSKDDNGILINSGLPNDKGGVPYWKNQALRGAQIKAREWGRQGKCFQVTILVVHTADQGGDVFDEYTVPPNHPEWDTY